VGRLEAAPQAFVVVALLEMGGDDVADDPAADRIGQVALEPIPDLDPHLAVVLGDEEEGAVVLLLSSHPPFARHLE